MSTHLIQFPGKEEYKLAIKALSDVPFTRVGLPDLKMAVFESHIEALKRTSIPFTDLTKKAQNDAKATVQP